MDMGTVEQSRAGSARKWSPDNPLHLTVWSGPRNISTALMRSWGNRPDTFVCDEPFYGCYLKETGADHPMADEVIAHHETDWRRVIDFVTGPPPAGKTIFYQKQMNKHMLDHIDMSWVEKLVNCFLIREPREIITSWINVVDIPTHEDLGLQQQIRMFRWLWESTGETPIVVDSRDILENPRRVLGRWCDALNVEFREEMLEWPPGRRATDGVWAAHWYKNVEKSTTFGPYRPKDDQVPDHLVTLLEECEELYHELHQYRIH